MCDPCRPADMPKNVVNGPLRNYHKYLSTENMIDIFFTIKNENMIKNKVNTKTNVSLNNPNFDNVIETIESAKIAPDTYTMITV